MSFLSIDKLKEKAVPLAFFNIYVIWGSTFLAVSYGLKGFPPFLLSGLRFTVAGLLLLLWRVARGEKLPTFSDWKKNAVTGILILTGGSGLVAWGEQYVTSTEAAIAIATGPFWFVAVDKNNWKKYFSDRFILYGLVLGFAGLLLFLSGSVSAPNANVSRNMRIVAFAVLALSSVSWVLGSLYSRKHKAGSSTFSNIAQQLLLAGAAALTVSGAKGEWTGFSFTAVPLVSWFGLAFLVLFGSVVAYLSYIWLLGVRPPAIVSTHTYINPIVAVGVGWLFLGEGIGKTQGLGLGIILLGVLLTNTAGYLNLRTKVKVRSRVRKTRRFIVHMPGRVGAFRKW